MGKNGQFMLDIYFYDGVAVNFKKIDENRCSELGGLFRIKIGYVFVRNIMQHTRKIKVQNV